LTIDVSEPFRSALAQSRASEVCDENAQSAADFFGRGMARLALGRRDDARSDFLAAQKDFEWPCALELIFLNLQTGGSELEAIADVRMLLRKIESRSLLAARALHVLAIAEQKAGNIPEALLMFTIAMVNSKRCVAAMIWPRNILRYPLPRNRFTATNWALQLRWAIWGGSISNWAEYGMRSVAFKVI
jgi:hypothetical protein